MEENASCMYYYQHYPDPSSSSITIISFGIFYVTCFILGLAGNSLLIYVTLNNKTLQTVQNIFILNLAASDVMMCLLSLPITPVTNVYKNWYFGSVLCHLIPCIQGISIFICTFSLGAIAVDRYILVVRPHTRPLSRRGAFTTTISLWIISIVATLPYALYMEMVEYEADGICGQFCTEKWPSDFSRRAYTMIVMVFQFLFPFAMMAFCYSKIFGVLSTRAKVKLRKMDERSMALENSCVINPDKDQKSDTMNNFLDKQERERQKLTSQTRRTTLILFAMVVFFGLTWLPHNVVSLIIEYDDSRTFFHISGEEENDISYLLNLFTHSIAMSNIVVNPVLYAWLNPSFRQLVVKTWKNCVGSNEKQRVINRTSAYLNIPRRINEVSHIPPRNETTLLVNGVRASSDTLVEKEADRESLIPRHNSTLEKQVKVDFCESDTFV